MLSRSGVLNATRNSTNSFTSLSYSITQDQWYNATIITNTVNFISFYVNGQSILNSGSIGGTIQSASTIQLGRNLVGNIGHFTFYKGRVLTAQEVYNNYIADRGRFDV